MRAVALEAADYMIAGTPKEPKHHYIPCFYLQQWANKQSRLIEYSRQGKHNFVRARPTSPKGTGYVRGLNLIPGAPPEVAAFVEVKFMRAVDDWAARALVAFLDSNKEPSLKERVGWSRFLYSLILRTPEYIERIRQKSLEYKIQTSPQELLPTLINSHTVIDHLTRMAWHVADFKNSNLHLLTSDRPLIMTNGLSSDDAHLVMPISPTRLFIAVQRHSMFESLKALDTKLVETSNTIVAQQAIRYVYGIDDSQVFFIAGHLGKKRRSTPLD